MRKTQPYFSALMLVAAAIVMPAIMGWMGLDRYFPYLAFTPLHITFAAGPLLLLAASGRRSRKRFSYFLLPALLQCLAYAWLFLQPVDVQSRFHGQWYAPVVSRIEEVLAHVALLIGGIGAWAGFRPAVPPQSLRLLAAGAVALSVIFLYRFAAQGPGWLSPAWPDFALLAWACGAWAAFRKP